MLKRIISFCIFLFIANISFGIKIGLDSGHSIKELYKSGGSFMVKKIDPQSLNETNVPYFSIGWPAGGEGVYSTRPAQLKDRVVKEKEAVVEEKPVVTDLSSEYYKVIATYFSSKGYDAGRVYGIQDVIIPGSVEGAVTNLGKNWLVFLRNEIFARHGYNLQSDYLKETLGKAGWYKVDTNFNIVKSLSKEEGKNAAFLQKLEKIDKDGPTNARQLAVILKLPKEQLTTDEAIKVYKATGEKGVLTKVGSKEVEKFEGKGEVRIYKEMREKLSMRSLISEWDIYDNKIFNFVANFNLGDRLYIGFLPNDFEYVLEPVIKTSDFYYDEEGGQYFYPYSFDVDEEGNVWVPLKRKGIDMYDYNGSYVTNILLQGDFTIVAYIKIENRKRLVINENAGNIELNYLDSTNWALLDGKEAEKYYELFKEPQYDKYGDTYSKKDYNEICINDVPVIRDVTPNGSYYRNFIVTPEADIYFRWVVTRGSYYSENKNNKFEKLYILFRLKKIGG